MTFPLLASIPQCSLPGKGSTPILLFAKERPRSPQSQGWEVSEALPRELVLLLQQEHSFGSCVHKT